MNESIPINTRKVIFVGEDKEEHIGFFHKWTFDSENDEDYALIETDEGHMIYVPVWKMKFIASKDVLCCSRCEHFTKNNMQYPCSHCSHCYTDKFQPRKDG